MRSRRSGLSRRAVRPRTGSPISVRAPPGCWHRAERSPRRPASRHPTSSRTGRLPRSGLGRWPTGPHPRWGRRRARRSMMPIRSWPAGGCASVRPCGRWRRRVALPCAPRDGGGGGYGARADARCRGAPTGRGDGARSRRPAPRGDRPPGRRGRRAGRPLAASCPRGATWGRRVEAERRGGRRRDEHTRSSRLARSSPTGRDAPSTTSPIVAGHRGRAPGRQRTAPSALAIAWRQQAAGRPTHPCVRARDPAERSPPDPRLPGRRPSDAGASSRHVRAPTRRLAGSGDGARYADRRRPGTPPMAGSARHDARRGPGLADHRASATPGRASRA
jgi:hypothetical protein